MGQDINSQSSLHGCWIATHRDTGYGSKTSMSLLPQLRNRTKSPHRSERRKSARFRHEQPQQTHVAAGDIALPLATLFRGEVSLCGLLPVLAVEKPAWSQHGALNIIEATGIDGDPVRAHARYPVRMDAAELAEYMLCSAGVEPIGRQRVCARQQHEIFTRDGQVQN